MSDPTDPTDQSNWRGFYYELALVVGSRSDSDADERLAAAVAAMWADNSLHGCYLEPLTAWSMEARVRPAAALSSGVTSLYGSARLPNGNRMVCVSHIIRPEPDSPDDEDWLYLSLPGGALGRADPRYHHHPLPEPLSRLWREPLDDWFASIAARIVGTATFRLGIIGEEVAGDDSGFTGERPAHDGVSFLTPTGTGVSHLKPAMWK